jgi:LmbE family N-acetylglucosaminyl deacetylase
MQVPQATADLAYRLRGLGKAGAVLHLGAHPDDEHSGTLAYLSRRHGVRTVYWSATLGEGGQNRLGPESGEALGILRTWETLAARALDGAEALYGPFYDFGFSKQGEDTLARWGRERVVLEIVRAIRLVQPLLVISRWSGEAGEGHGHHQAIGLAAEEAFAAAADRARFPELLDTGLPPWQARKLYRSLGADWQPGEGVKTGAAVAEYEGAEYLRLDTGETDPLVGLTYQEQADLARNCHRSQGMGLVPDPGPFFYYYRLVLSLTPSGTRDLGFFEGLDPTLTGLAEHVDAPSALRDLLGGGGPPRRRGRRGLSARGNRESGPGLGHGGAPGRCGRCASRGTRRLGHPGAGRRRRGRSPPEWSPRIEPSGSHRHARRRPRQPPV